MRRKKKDIDQKIGEIRTYRKLMNENKQIPKRRSRTETKTCEGEKKRHRDQKIGEI